MQFKLELVKATIVDAPIIENMWYYYVYDLTRYCGHKEGWESPTDPSFKSDDLTHYFTEKDSNVFLIKIGTEYAGFLVVKKLNVMAEVDWFMSEFFIISKYQHFGIGESIAKEVFEKFHGEWAVGILPENIRALHFWRKIITKFTDGNFYEIEKTRDQLKTLEHPNPYSMKMLRFKSSQLKVP